jgi:hypothetical protein
MKEVGDVEPQSFARTILYNSSSSAAKASQRWLVVGKNMITTQTSASLAQLSSSTGAVPADRATAKEPPTARTNLSLERIDCGLDLETKNLPDLRSRENFFLDIAFYRTY